MSKKRPGVVQTDGNVSIQIRKTATTLQVLMNNIWRSPVKTLMVSSHLLLLNVYGDGGGDGGEAGHRGIANLGKIVTVAHLGPFFVSSSRVVHCVWR